VSIHFVSIISHFQVASLDLYFWGDVQSVTYVFFGYRLNTISGWGTLSSGGSQPYILQKANVT
jgi:hypothetical protein